MTERELRAACEEAVRLGGAIVKERFGARGEGAGPRTVEKKGAIDLVTDADRASEAAVLGFLAARFPGDAVLAEESGAHDVPASRRRWYVDPLDGTTNYAHSVPHFCVTVAVEDEAGLAAAATLDPLRDECFLAARGAGATLNGVPLAVSSPPALSEALLCTGFPYDIRERPEPVISLFSTFVRRARGVRRMGAAALDLAWVACGRFDGFWEDRLKPWDVAAGTLLVREAGGEVSAFHSGPSPMGGDICAASSALHAEMLGVIAAVVR
jgi:myo-inositol-1(or 4)-monophosphatase